MKNKICLFLYSLWSLSLLASCGSMPARNQKASYLEEKQFETIYRDIKRLLKKTENLSVYKMKRVTVL